MAVSWKDIQRDTPGYKCFECCTVICVYYMYLYECLSHSMCVCDCSLNSAHRAININIFRKALMCQSRQSDLRCSHSFISQLPIEL